jgi:hypothetical protein
VDPSKTRDTRRITNSWINDTSSTTPLKLSERAALTTDEKVTLFADTQQDISTTNADVDRNSSEVTKINSEIFWMNPLVVGKENKLQRNRLNYTSTEIWRSSWSRWHTEYRFKKLAPIGPQMHSDSLSHFHKKYLLPVSMEDWKNY